MQASLPRLLLREKPQEGSKARFPCHRGYLVYSGSPEEQRQARRDLLVLSRIAAAGIVLLLAIEFRTARNLSLILTKLPFALVGGVLAVFATGGLLSIGSLVGFVALFEKNSHPQICSGLKSILLGIAKESVYRKTITPVQCQQDT